VKERGVIIAETPYEQTLVAADRSRAAAANLIGNALKHARGTSIAHVATHGKMTLSCATRVGDDRALHIFDRYWSGRARRGGAGPLA
jgi:hypothetical protein